MLAKEIETLERCDMRNEDIFRILGAVGAIVTGSHIVYTSGKHGSAYVNKDAIYPHTNIVSMLCREIAEKYLYDNIEVVVGPALGGIILSQWTTHAFNERYTSSGSSKRVLSVFCEKESELFVFKRGYEKLIRGKSVLVVEDVLNTGGSAREVIELVHATGGYVRGVGALCNRGGVKSADLCRVPRLLALVDIAMHAFDKSECPYCKQGVPINTTVGHGKRFLADQCQ